VRRIAPRTSGNNGCTARAQIFSFSPALRSGEKEKTSHSRAR